MTDPWENGPTGATGATGPQGSSGATGVTGVTGQPVPRGNGPVEFAAEEEAPEDEVNYAALPPDNPMKTGTYVQGQTGEPQIRVQSPEGVQMDVDASQEEDLVAVGFEVIAGADDLADNGTRTSGADPEQIARADAEREQAEKALGLRR